MQIKEKILFEYELMQAPGNIVSDMDGEKVMLNIENGKYYNLGNIGGLIWDMLKEPINFETLVFNLLSEFDVEKTECEEQVYNFIQELYSEGLISVVSDVN